MHDLNKPRTLSQPPICMSVSERQAAKHDDIAHQNNAIHWLRLHHLLRVHRHQVPEVHARRVREALVQADRRERHGQRAREHHAALDGLDERGDVPVARVEARRGVDDADDGSVERVVRVACAFDECLAQEERECVVPAE